MKTSGMNAAELHNRVESIMLAGIDRPARRPRGPKASPELREAAADLERCYNRAKAAQEVFRASRSASADNAQCLAEGDFQKARDRLLGEIGKAAGLDQSGDYENCVLELPDGTIVGVQTNPTVDTDQYPIFMFKRTSVIRLED
jgi:hypothetical protein